MYYFQHNTCSTQFNVYVQAAAGGAHDAGAVRRRGEENGPPSLLYNPASCRILSAILS